MVVLSTKDSYEILMKSYIEVTLKMYGKEIKYYTTPTRPSLFDVKVSKPAQNRAKFHSVVARLLYLGNHRRPDILLAIQFLCTSVKAPTVGDCGKLEECWDTFRCQKGG
jgi:hypothetical protein